VGQGTVDAALSLRPEERRQLFEEAAGVKGLQVKRNEASGRLGEALDNLARVSDILGELKPQVRRLALQAEHSQQHDALGARARALVLTSHRRREQAARAALGEARRASAAAEAALDEYRSAQDAGRELLAAAEARYWQAEEAARQAGRQREETRAAVIRAESRIEALDSRILELSAATERDAALLVDAERELAAFEDGTADAAVAPALTDAAAAEEAWRATVEALATADQELIAAEEAVAAVRVRDADRIAAAARAGEAVARHRARRDQLAEERRQIAATFDGARGELRHAVEADEQASNVAGEAAAAADLAATDRDEAQVAADTTAHRAVELTERLRATRAELDAIAEPHDAGSRLGRRLAAAGWATLLDAIDAPPESWPAIEAVVGGELEGALLWSDDDPSAEVRDARGAARLLASGSGPATEGRDDALAAVGAEETLAEWVKAAHAPLAFQRTAVARDLASLLEGWRRLPAGWSAVTPDGDLADARGLVVLRGRADPPGGAAARIHARRRELSAATAALEAELATAQDAAHRANERLRAARDAHLAARNAQDSAGRDRRVAADERAAAAGAVERLGQRIGALDAEIAELGLAAPPETPPPGADEGPAQDVERLQAVADAARRRRDEAAMARDKARERWTATRSTAELAEGRIAGRRQARALAEARVAQLGAAIPDRHRTLDEQTAERAALAEELAAAGATDEAAVGVHAAAEARRTELRAALLELESAQGGGSQRLAELERAAQATAIEASRRDEALSALARERELALDGLPETESEAPIKEVEGLGDEHLVAELRRVRRMLSQIGSVNPFAVEEHRELAARLDEMTTQDRDLRAAIASTEELIERLDNEIAGQFDTAFRAIAERFDEFCQLLFAGGSGSLQMADEADGDAPGGIEIVVRPPGKRLQRLAMLSGGERALTGVALLFAMLTVNPVPFCILDEVDAALDEANIGRFADALRKLSESIDFVVITHNRATIEVADTIYGVTMTDAAVSRVLSLRLADLPAEVSA
jgi:chromosome segregation protein